MTCMADLDLYDPSEHHALLAEMARMLRIVPLTPVPSQDVTPPCVSEGAGTFQGVE